MISQQEDKSRDQPASDCAIGETIGLAPERYRIFAS
jgi:hypothetical protein